MTTAEELRMLALSDASTLRRWHLDCTSNAWIAVINARCCEYDYRGILTDDELRMLLIFVAESIDE